MNMQKNKAGKTIQVLIKEEAWLRRKKIEIPAEYLNFFPADSLGRRGKDEVDIYPLRGKNIEFDYGITKKLCDIATRKNGITRPRNCSAFFDDNKVEVGDIVCFTKTSDYCYSVSLVKK